MRNIALALVLMAAAPLVADPVEEVRQAEIAFAKAFVDRDQQKFFSMVASDATFLGPNSTLSGRPEVIKGWSGLFKDPIAPISWSPERVHVNAAGNIGFSYGPVRDRNGKHFGNYTSIWVKQSDGSWKVLFDGPGCDVCAAKLAPAEAAVEEGFVTTADGARLHYRKAGNGPRTVIVPLGWVLFDDFMQFSDIATMIFYDLRNRGRSSAVADVSTLTVQQDVRDLETVRRHFNVEKFSAIGYSYLGLVVAMYALDHPQRVERIVQMGPVGFAGTTYPAHLRHTDADIGAPAEEVNKFKEMMKAGAKSSAPREFCEQQWKVMSYYQVGTAEGVKRAGPSHCDLENEWPVNFQRHVERLWPTVHAVRLTRDDLQRLQQPVLTIHGTKDRNAPYGAGREWAMTLPNGRLLTVEGAAHASWADAPDVVFNAVRVFLNGEWPRNVERVTKLDPKS